MLIIIRIIIMMTTFSLFAENDSKEFSLFSIKEFMYSSLARSSLNIKKRKYVEISCRRRKHLFKASPKCSDSFVALNSLLK